MSIINPLKAKSSEIYTQCIMSDTREILTAFGDYQLIEGIRIHVTDIWENYESLIIGLTNHVSQDIPFDIEIFNLGINILRKISKEVICSRHRTLYFDEGMIFRDYRTVPHLFGDQGLITGMPMGIPRNVQLYVYLKSKSTIHTKYDVILLNTILHYSPRNIALDINTVHEINIFQYKTINIRGESTKSHSYIINMNDYCKSFARGFFITADYPVTMSKISAYGLDLYDYNESMLKVFAQNLDGNPQNNLEILNLHSNLPDDIINIIQAMTGSSNKSYCIYLPFLRARSQWNDYDPDNLFYMKGVYDSITLYINFSKDVDEYLITYQIVKRLKIYKNRVTLLDLN